MSTSFFYHTFGTKPYKYLKADFQFGRTYVYLEKKRAPRCCKYCKCKNIVANKNRKLTLKTVPVGFRETFLVLHLKSYRCQNCWRTFQENRVIAEPYRSYTKKFEHYVLGLAKSNTIKDIARLLNVSWDIVKEIIYRNLEKRAKKLSWSNVRFIAIDEFAIQKVISI